jgi:hypothetical protein
MAKLKFRVQDGKIIIPTDQEQIADALAEVRAGLKHIKDPRVWGGYPDGWPDNEDEDEDGAPIGLVLKLERWTRGNPTRSMAWAIEIAFALGKVTQAGAGGLDEQTWRRLLSGASPAQINASKSAYKRGKEAASQLAMVKRFVAEERALSPGVDPKVLSGRIWKRMEKILGDDCRAEATISDWIRKKIDGKPAGGRKATRRGDDARRI